MTTSHSICCARPPCGILPHGRSLSILAFCLLSASCEEKEGAARPPLPLVKVASVLQRDVPIHFEAIGETRGNREIEIRARVEGFVDSVDFEEGSLVDKGQLLYSIDPRTYETAVARANASVAEAEARLARTHQDVVRYEPLLAKNAIAREEYETAVALERATAARLDAQKALRERAEIDLSYTKVVAPEAGLVGKTEVNAGTLVGRGQSTMLTRISLIDPIHVRFSLSEGDYLRYARKLLSGARSDDQVPFELILADGTTHPEQGRLVFVDRAVDPRTGTILAEATFPNPQLLVRPGQFTRIRALVEERRGAILLPQRAVEELQGVFSVMVVGSEDRVEQRLVKSAQRVQALWLIDSGLRAGERVVVEGQQRIRPGMQVTLQVVRIDAKAVEAE